MLIAKNPKQSSIIIQTLHPNAATTSSHGQRNRAGAESVYERSSPVRMGRKSTVSKYSQSETKKLLTISLEPTLFLSTSSERDSLGNRRSVYVKVQKNILSSFSYLWRF